MAMCSVICIYRWPLNPGGETSRPGNNAKAKPKETLSRRNQKKRSVGEITQAHSPNVNAFPVESGELKRNSEFKIENHFKRKTPNPLFTHDVIGANSTALPQQGRVIEGGACEEGLWERGCYHRANRLLAG